MRAVEIDSVEGFDDAAARASAAGRPTLRRWQVQGLDLRSRDAVLHTFDPRGALFLGCRFADGTEDWLRGHGALVFPQVPDVPFDPWRARLYTPAELYAHLDHGYAATLDARVYAWYRGRTVTPPVHDTLAMAVHDNSVDDALEEFVAGRRIVGVMGGHELGRDTPAYLDAALLGHALAGRGLTIATGGGPGAMEAANLGARLASGAPDQVRAVVRRIAAVPTFTPDVDAWARAGLDAVADLPASDSSLGVPTWFYGHEPPNVFAARIAKYFENAIREDVLLRVSRAGVVYLPGAAGTVQEIFQAACENYYAPADQVAPMVLVGHDYWTRTLPAWPLLRALGAGRPFGPRLQLVDSTADAVAALGEDG